MDAGYQTQIFLHYTLLPGHRKLHEYDRTFLSSLLFAFTAANFADLRKLSSRFTPDVSRCLPGDAINRRLYDSLYSHLTFHATCLMSHISRLMSHISHLASHISHLTSHISHLTSHISHLTSHISRLTSHADRLLNSRTNPKLHIIQLFVFTIFYFKKFIMCAIFYHHPFFKD